MSTMREIIGQNVKRERRGIGMQQDAFAERLAALSGRAWTISAVSEAERGKRTWTADDVVLFARALALRPADLFSIPSDVDQVEIDGQPVSREVIEPDARALSDRASAPLQVIARLTRALDSHLDEITALHGAVEQTYADAIGARKTWLRQTAEPQPRKEDE
ncbi:helix-turn-helix domain-containing protein [Microbacterium insulae]|uniref:Helix-turn-helix domain-containing protein n=1 Tax=Microbacterium insulae TaxID=483014 RepID=A0ABW3AL74_9MICO